jgi:hypothetical protein
MLVKALFAGVPFSLSLAVSGAEAQDARVVVPDTPTGALISSCYRSDRLHYGPHRLTFCGDRGRQGIYSVQGPQLTCEGRLGRTMVNARSFCGCASPATTTAPGRRSKSGASRAGFRA